MNNKDINNLLHAALYAGAEATDRIHGGGGEHMRKLADKLYGNGHVLLTPATCTITHYDDRQCPVCDGGLAVCANCNEFEAGLDKPCKPRPSAPLCVCDHYEHKPTGQCVACGRFCGAVSSEVGGSDLRAWEGESAPIQAAQAMTGIHDSSTCRLGKDSGPCEVCVEAIRWERRPGKDRVFEEWNLEVAMNDFLNDYGPSALMEKIEGFVTERGLY